MKFTIERAALLKSLSHVQNVVERRHTNPLLSNVKITAEDGEEGRIVLNATDNELEISENAPAKVNAAGSITAPAHKLYEIIRKLPDGAEIEFSLNTEKGQLNIAAGRAKFALATMPGEDFPTIADGEMTHTFVLPAQDLQDLIERTAFAVSTEETRYYLNGIYLHEATSKEEKILRAVATDGHRLACAEAVFPEGAAGMPGIIIPRKAIGELSKLLAEESGEVKVALSTYKIQFTFGNLILTSLLIEGTYPDYERVIPLENDKILEVEAPALRSTVWLSCPKNRALSVCPFPKGWSRFPPRTPKREARRTNWKPNTTRKGWMSALTTVICWMFWARSRAAWCASLSWIRRLRLF